MSTSKLLIPLAGVLFPLAVTAVNQDTIRHQQIDLSEVVVKSFKQHNTLSKEAISATTITERNIYDRNIGTIKEFSANIPNLYMPDYGSKLTSPIYVRGIGSKINSPSVGLYIDGVPYFEKSAFDFGFAEINRIEVLRGPQGTLYGRNTMGGIINVYTKSPLQYQGTRLSVHNGNYGKQGYFASHYGKLGNNFGYAVSGNYKTGDGYFKNEFTDKEADSWEEGNLRARLEWKVRNNLTLGFSTSYDMLNQGGYPYAVCDDNYQPSTVNYNDYSSYKRHISTNGLTLDFKGERLQLNSKSSFQYLTDHQRLDQDFTSADLFFGRQDQKQKMFSEELNMKSVGDSRYKWLVGAFGFWQQVDNEVGVDMKPKNMGQRMIYDTPTYGLALYHQSTFDRLFVDGLSLTLGLRYDYEHASNKFWHYADIAGHTKQLNELDSDLDFGELTPKITLQYNFPTSGMVYASVTKGYKTGGFNISFDTEADRTFDPETSWNYEVGAKLPLFDHRLTAEVALFWIDWKNQQITQTLQNGQGNMLKNAGRSESKGIELSLRYKPVNGLDINVNYGFTHATFKDYVDAVKKTDYSGNYLQLVPSHTLGAGVNYTKNSPCPFLDRFDVGLDFSGNGKIYWANDNNVEQPFYGLLNANIAFTKSFATLGFWAKNITNTKYTAFYFESMGKKLAQKGNPFTFGGKITLSF